MRVLLATDGSVHAEEAAWLLSHLPHDEPLELFVVCVHKPLEVHGSVDVVAWMKEKSEQERQRAVDTCKRIEGMFEGAMATVKVITREGHPGREIVTAAEENQIDLVVLGAEGHAVVERVFLGSVSDFVATHAPCSVLVVRPTGLRQREHAEMKICLAYDDSEPCRYAVDQLAKFKLKSNVHLDVVSVLNIPFTYMSEPIEIDHEPLRQSMLETTAAAARSLTAIAPEPTPHVLEGSHVGETLVQFTKKNGTDLIVLGSTGFGLIARFLLGSVSRFVLRHAACSVMIARQND
ncbi:MAG: universal stress protein [bacterium]|nr:universal stress protein [bacterium]